jgi:ribonucleoside-diphosphate reductase subunit M1
MSSYRATPTALPGTTTPHEKVLQRLQRLASGFAPDDAHTLLTKLNLEALTESILRGMYPDVTSFEIDTLAAETAASMATQHVLYARLAARILVSRNHKGTPATFSGAIGALAEDTGFIDPEIAALVERRGDEINSQIRNERDLEMTYFGFKTLERSYLLRSDDGRVLERPQYLMMRVALGIHCRGWNSTTNPNDDNSDGSRSTMSREEEDKRLEAAFETYHLMSQGYFMHASPTLFHSGTTHPQLSSCFLVQMSDDSIAGIYDTLKRCSVISKAAGGIGLSVHNIRARGTPIRGTRGVSNGLVPMLRVYDATSRYVDQGGGKRPGAFAIYLEPWHADILDVLNLKKNHGKEEQRARDLFYGLWIPDLFMERVENDELWSLMCPHQCPGLSESHGKSFEETYKKYEQEGRFVKQMRARDVWSAILESQIETGTPYMLYKDACNEKSNQKNLGTIQCSNLCTEIIQYTDEQEVAVCNLASM